MVMNVIKEIRVLLIERGDLAQLGLRKVLEQYKEVSLVSQVSSLRHVAVLLKKSNPDIVVINLEPSSNSDALLRLVRNWKVAFFPKILLLSWDRSEEFVISAFGAGVDSYYLKSINFPKTNVDTSTFLDALRATYEGQHWIDPEIAGYLLKNSIKSPVKKFSGITLINSCEPDYYQILRENPLTERELTVLELIVAGYTNDEIAERLLLGLGTVKTHIRSLLWKLCCDDRTQAAVQALRSGLVK
ncbi:MAG: response regulator transcription factor [Moorea sp. SIO4A3]|nr:response regulator transcription factor [Moorena sp. SIO4A3]